MNKFLLKSKIFKLLLVFFMLGIFLRSFFVFDLFLTFIIFLASMVLMITFWHKVTFKLIFLFIIFLTLGIFRYEFYMPKSNSLAIEFYNDEYISFEGVVSRPVDVYINYTKLKIKALKYNNQEVSGNVLVSTGMYPRYKYGDLLNISCNLRAPESFNDFAYDRYLAQQGIYSLCSHPRIKLIEHNQGNLFLQNIFKIKRSLQHIINRNLEEPHASVLSAMTLGVKRGVPKDVTEVFSKTGTSHLIAISGLHITLLITIITQLLLSLQISRKKSFFVTTIVIIFYLLIIGFPASAVRASVMGWMVMLALYVGRLNASINALLFVGALMIFVNPLILRDGIGFQLSFTAVLGLIYFSPALEKITSKITNIFGLRQSLQMTIAAQLSTMPLIIYYFGRVSFVAPIVNILVLPLIPYLMIFGFGALALSMIFTPFAQYLFWPVWLVLSIVFSLINLFADFSFSAIDIL